MPVPSLSTELLELILVGLYDRDDRQALRLCNIVSKAFRAVARPLLYRSIVLDLQGALELDERIDVGNDADFSRREVWLYSERTRNLMRLLEYDSTLNTRVRHATLALASEASARTTPRYGTPVSDFINSLVDLLPNVDSFDVRAGSLLKGFHQLLASRAVTLDTWKCAWSDIAKLPKLRHLRIEANSITRQPFNTESIASLHIGQDIVFDHVDVLSFPPFDGLVELSLPLDMLVTLDLARLHNLTHLRLCDPSRANRNSLPGLAVATVNFPTVTALTILINLSHGNAPIYLAWLASSLFPLTSDYILHPSDADDSQDLRSSKTTPGFPSMRRLNFSVSWIPSASLPSFPPILRPLTAMPVPPLPTETLQHILAFVTDRRALWACNLVSRTFRSITHERLYEEICFRYHDVDLDESCGFNWEFNKAPDHTVAYSRQTLNLLRFLETHEPLARQVEDLAPRAEDYQVALDEVDWASDLSWLPHGQTEGPTADATQSSDIGRLLFLKRLDIERLDLDGFDEDLGNESLKQLRLGSEVEGLTTFNCFRSCFYLLRDLSLDFDCAKGVNCSVFEQLARLAINVRELRRDSDIAALRKMVVGCHKVVELELSSRALNASPALSIVKALFPGAGVEPVKAHASETSGSSDWETDTGSDDEIEDAQSQPGSAILSSLRCLTLGRRVSLAALSHLVPAFARSSSLKKKRIRLPRYDKAIVLIEKERGKQAPKKADDDDDDDDDEDMTGRPTILKRTSLAERAQAREARDKEEEEAFKELVAGASTLCEDVGVKLVFAF
ncbi:hypothetical protein JCM10212_004492 [Sporobolomyces blumeae]